MDLGTFIWLTTKGTRTLILLGLKTIAAKSGFQNVRTCTCKSPAYSTVGFITHNS